MTLSNNFTEIIAYLAVILGAIAGILKSSIEIAKWFSRVTRNIHTPPIYKFLLRFSAFLFFFLSLAAPNGLLVWYAMFLIGKNLDHFLSPNVYYTIILQVTLAVSIYSYIWGIWLAPLLRHHFKQEENPT